MKNKKINLCIILSMILTIILFVLFKNEHFAPDTYIFELDVNENANWYLVNGRFIMTLFLKICIFLNISCKNIKFISLIISLISLFLSNILLNKITTKYVKSKNVSAMISTAIIYSPFIFEFFIFTEYTGIMSLGLLMSILASIYIEKYFEESKLKYIFISTLFAFLSVSSYQGVIGCFVALTAIHIAINYKNIKKFIKENIYVVSIYGIVSLISLVITKLCGLSRVDTAGYNLLETIKRIITGTTSLVVNTAHVYPKYYYLLILVFIVILTVFYCIKNGIIKKILLTLYLILVVTLFSLAPQFLVHYDSVWIVARSNIALGMLFGILCFWYISLNQEKNIYSKFTVIIISLTLLLQCIGWYQISVDHYYINKLDQLVVEDVITKIESYENKNNVLVTKLGITNDKNPTYTYETVETMFGDVNVRATNITWAISGILEYYGNKKYEVIPANDEIIKHCSNNDWNGISDDLLIFDDDTLYMCIF